MTTTRATIDVLDAEQQHGDDGYTYLLWEGSVIEWDIEWDAMPNHPRPRFDTREEARVAGIAETVRKRQIYLDHIIDLSIAIAEMDKAMQKFKRLEGDHHEQAH